MGERQRRDDDRTAAIARKVGEASAPVVGILIVGVFYLIIRLIKGLIERPKLALILFCVVGLGFLYTAFVVPIALQSEQAQQEIVQKQRDIEFRDRDLQVVRSRYASSLTEIVIMPLFEKDSWKDTGIVVVKGDRIRIAKLPGLSSFAATQWPTVSIKVGESEPSMVRDASSMISKDAGAVYLHVENLKGGEEFIRILITINHAVEESSSTEVALQSTQQPAADGVSATGVVIAEVLNIRSGPGVDYDIVGKLYINSTVTIQKQDETGNWLYILFEESSGWVSRKFVRLETE